MTKNIPMDVDTLKAGMILGETIFDASGNTLLSEGVILRKVYIEKIKGLGYLSVRIQADVAEISGVKESADGGNIEKEQEIILETTRIQSAEFVEKCMASLCEAGDIDADKLYLIVNAIIEEIFKNDDVMVNLSQLKNVGEYEFHHGVNVCVLSIVCGIYMGFHKNRLLEIGIGALLHDVGKAFIPEEILLAPRSLTEEEFHHVKQHPMLGYEALKRIPKIVETSACVALYHHERMDGSGYPTGKIGKTIHVYSKIVAVADVYDAIISQRPYREKKNPYYAMEQILKTTDTYFDREVVRVFLKVVGYYPVGLHVSLSTGESGIVMKKNRNRPLVRILKLI